MPGEPLKRFRTAVAATVLLVGLAGAACRGSGAGRGTGTGTSAPAPSEPAVSVAVPATGAATVPATVTSTPAGPGPCLSSALALEVGEGRAALGRGLSVFELRNTSGSSCRLSGYPTVVVVDAAGQAMAEARAEPGYLLAGRGPTPVLLAPGAAAYFGVETDTVCNQGARPAASDGVRVSPPGEPGAPLAAEITIGLCPGRAVLVSPVRASEDEITR